jgi:hypothetical protein
MAKSAKKRLIDFEIDHEVKTRKALLDMVSVLNSKNSHLFSSFNKDKVASEATISTNRHREPPKKDDGYIWWLHDAKDKSKKK